MRTVPLFFCSVMCSLLVLAGCVSSREEEAQVRRTEWVETGRFILKDSEAAERSEIPIPFRPRFEVSGFNDPALSASTKKKMCGSKSGC